ncbi:MAG: prepilin-type N-terminal cleavage/methylation domain-containing protein [Dehalococcoidia bacterium]|jgi:type IV pilus assembly protein PilA
MMRKLFKGFRKGEKGFTLIELLVVIAILGIIAAIVVPNFGNFFGRGQAEACEIEERMVKTVTIAYASDNGACPTAIANLSGYFEDETAIQGSYTFAGTYPNCTVTQDVPCPAVAEE